MMDTGELRLLSALLGAPDETSLELLREAAAEFPWLEGAVEELARTPLDRWQGEHTMLFIAGFPRTPCLPFASAWMEKRMHGAAMESLLLFYRRLGLEAAEMPADYLGTILECAAMLREQEDRGLAAELWNGHLHPWLQEFTAALAQHSRLKLYGALARRLDDLSDEHRLETAAAPA
jgi:TorA maturation chaperone TorD